MIESLRVAANHPCEVFTFLICSLNIINVPNPKHSCDHVESRPNLDKEMFRWWVVSERGLSS
jgi:hypothetical protein